MQKGFFKETLYARRCIWTSGGPSMSVTPTGSTESSGVLESSEEMIMQRQAVPTNRCSGCPLRSRMKCSKESSNQIRRSNGLVDRAKARGVSTEGKDGRRGGGWRGAVKRGYSGGDCHSNRYLGCSEPQFQGKTWNACFHENTEDEEQIGIHPLSDGRKGQGTHVYDPRLETCSVQV